MAEVCLELSVEVLLPVHFIDEGVQTHSILSVLVQNEDLDSVDLSHLEHGRRDGHVVVLEDASRGLYWLPINGVVADFDSTEVEKDLGLWRLEHLKANVDAAGVPLTTRQVKFHIV